MFNKKLVLSSLSFIVPTLLSKKYNVLDVCLSTFLVLTTSLLNHSTKQKVLRYTDIFYVNISGLYFTILSIFSYIKFKSIYFLLTPIIALIGLSIFIYNKLNNDSDYNHMLLHVLMSFGICIYAFGVFQNGNKTVNINDEISYYFKLKKNKLKGETKDEINQEIDDETNDENNDETNQEIDDENKDENKDEIKDVVILNCSHKYHYKCLNDCFKNNIKKCPLCRVEYI